MAVAVYVFILLLVTTSATALKVQCCRERGVTAGCANLFCDPRKPPGDTDIYTAFEDPSSCKSFLPAIATCLSEGHDASNCCQEKAERPDFNDCLEVCKGSARTAFDSWSHFQSCLAINVPPMYKCMMEAYRRSPSAPLGLRIVSKTSTSVRLEWSKPETNPSLVTKYKIVFAETSGRRVSEIVYESRDTSTSITTLIADKKYTVHVLAQGSGSEDLSQSSDYVQFSTSLRSQDEPVFSETVKLSRDAKTATLACHLRQGAVQNSRLIWERKEKGHFKQLDGNRFTITTYSEKIDGLRYYVSALEIKNLEQSDFTIYHCHLENEKNDFGEIKLQVHSFVENLPATPPDSPLECCSKAVTRPQCQSVCSGIAGVGKDIKPGAFLPQFRCFDEFNTLMRCTLQNLNNVGCCISQQIPYHCLGMCDSRYMLGNIFFSDCVNYVNKVFVCQEERVRNLPYAVSSLKVKSENDATTLEWEPSTDAELYHVYHRIRKGPWAGGATTQSKTITGAADEVAVLAVNKFGFSGVSRMAFVDNRWSSTYVV